MRILRSAICLVVIVQLLAVVPLTSALWELPSVNLFSPPEPFEFSSFLQGHWIAEVRVQGGVGVGNGFIATTMPAQGTLIGRFYENVTDSSEVKSQFLFQVGMSDPLSGNFRLALLSEGQSRSGVLLSEDEATSIFSDSIEKQLSAAFTFRVSLHNKMYDSFLCYRVVWSSSGNSHNFYMYVAFGTCEHPEHSKMTFHWTLFPDKNYIQLQLLLADGTTFFALAAHREVQLSFLQRYGYNVGIMALFFASKWFQYKQRPKLPASGSHK